MQTAIKKKTSTRGEHIHTNQRFQLNIQNRVATLDEKKPHSFHTQWQESKHLFR